MRRNAHIMIISHKHKFIFIHCRKVAGSSIASYLSRHLGPEDLMVGCWDDAIRWGSRFNRRLINEMISVEGVRLLVPQLLKSALRRKPPIAGTVNQVYRTMYARRIGMPLVASTLKEWAPSEWDDYFKFCFVRNSYPRAVSDWKWRTRGLDAARIPFLEFLTRVADPSAPDPERVVPSPRSNWPFYTISDEIAVDYVGRMETLECSMKHVCDVIGIPYSGQDFPHAKKVANVGNDYRKFYSDLEVELAYSAYKKEIDHFGFLF
jgi:hypothetical protein